MKRWGCICLAALVALSSLPGCSGIRTVKRTTATPENIDELPQKARFLKAHMRDGSLYVLDSWKVLPGDSAVEGTGERRDVNRDAVGGGPFVIPIDSVALFETNVVQTSPAMIPYTVLLVGTVAGVVYCITNPKACYGSCPTFYAEDGPRDLVQAESFSNSVAPFLEDTDVDALYRVTPSGSTLRLRVTNEALETHVIRRADVMAAPRPTNGRVARTVDGEYWEIQDWSPASPARGPEGDCTAALAAFDRIERFSLADSTDLATPETLELEFRDLPPGPHSLVIAARQTLVTTYLYYQTLAFMGNSAAAWMAALERQGTTLRSLATGLGRELGSIQVSVLDKDGTWISAGEAGETGPIATDVHLVRLPDAGVTPMRVRLRMARGVWRLDYVALAALGERVTPIRLPPARVTRDGALSVAASEALADSLGSLVTLPGDSYLLEYPLPPSPERYEYFLEARGYYLEWLREEWLKEENPGRARQIFLDPKGALRALAPEFKRAEPQMESLFWASRYENSK